MISIRRHRECHKVIHCGNSGLDATISVIVVETVQAGISLSGSRS